MPPSELEQIFEYVQKNGWSTARQIGKVIPGGTSRANHYLYGYTDILFVKRGLAPPQWKETTNDAYDQMIARLNPTTSIPVSRDAVVPIPPKRRESRFRSTRSPGDFRTRNLPRISVCASCDLPIQPTGRCGCS